MRRQQKPWFLLAMAGVLAGSLPRIVVAGGDEKAGAKPLPPEVVKAWTDAGARVGWMHVNPFGSPRFSPDKGAPAGAVVPAFQFFEWEMNTKAKLPDPGVPFGLSLVGTQMTDAGLKELADLKSLQSLDLGGTQVTDAGVAQLHKELPGCRIFR